MSDDGLKPEILSKTEQVTAALARLKQMWRDTNISLGSKVKLMRSLVISRATICKGQQEFPTTKLIYSLVHVIKR